MSIKCTLTYLDSGSLSQEVELQCLPSVGDRLLFDDGSEGVVRNVSHSIPSESKPHTITVHYEPEIN